MHLETVSEMPQPPSSMPIEGLEIQKNESFDTIMRILKEIQRSAGQVIDPDMPLSEGPLPESMYVTEFIAQLDNAFPKARAGLFMESEFLQRLPDLTPNQLVEKIDTWMSQQEHVS